MSEHERVLVVLVDVLSQSESMHGVPNGGNIRPCMLGTDSWMLGRSCLTMHLPYAVLDDHRLLMLCPPLPAEKPPKCKRKIQEPRGGFTIEGVTAQTVTPIPYDIVKEGLQS